MQTITIQILAFSLHRKHLCCHDFDPSPFPHAKWIILKHIHPICMISYTSLKFMLRMFNISSYILWTEFQKTKIFAAWVSWIMKSIENHRTSLHSGVLSIVFCDLCLAGQENAERQELAEIKAMQNTRLGSMALWCLLRCALVSP